MTMAAPARMSRARTGAADRRSTPRMTAWCPSVRMSAPIRLSSSTNMNRLSNTFSVAMLVPRGLEPAGSLDLDGGGAGAFDLRPHAHEHGGQVLDLRLPGGVLDDGGAGRSHRSHQEVLRGPDTREVQPDHRAPQAVWRRRV